MPSLSKKDIQIVLRKYPHECQFNIFVESGTALGWTTFAMEPLFEELHTIELKPEFYKRARSKYDGKKIQFYRGDSMVILPQILKKLTANTVFWLDGHYSSGRTARGSKDVPLLEELEAIYHHCSPAAIVMIDDYRLFGTSHSEDWREITLANVLKKLADRVVDYYNIPSRLHPKDRLIINISAGLCST